MVKLFGREYGKEELSQKVADISQVGGVRLSRLQQGPEDGVLVVDFCTGSGLAFTVVPSRGMDISAAEYRGQSLCTRTPVREVHPAFFEPGTQGWHRGFFQGILTTCGPTFFTAPPGPGELRTIQHGRATWTPARNLWCDESWEGEEYRMWAQGRMREGDLVWERRISTKLGALSFLLEDRVENQGFIPIPHRIQYHINGGFPIVDEGAEFIGTILGVYDRQGKEISPDFNHFGPPTTENPMGLAEQLMCADGEGYAYAALVNRAFGGGEGFGYYLKYRLDTLPYFWVWKMLAPGRYVVGTEPASHPAVNPMNPQVENQEVFAPLPPGEGRRYEIEFGVLPSNKEIEELEDCMAEVVESSRRTGAKERIGRITAASRPA